MNGMNITHEEIEPTEWIIHLTDKISMVAHFTPTMIIEKAKFKGSYLQPPDDDTIIESISFDYWEPYKTWKDLISDFMINYDKSGGDFDRDLEEYINANYYGEYQDVTPDEDDRADIIRDHLKDDFLS